MTTPFLVEDRKTYTDSELVIIYTEKIKKLTNLLDQQLGVPCAEIRWQQEKNELLELIDHWRNRAIDAERGDWM